MSRRFFFWGLVFYCVLGTSSTSLQASYVYYLEAFTHNGDYNGSGELDLYVEVADGGAGQVDFTFYNNSLVDSSISEIYFEDNLLLGFAGITNGPETLFGQSARPKNLPGAHVLEQVFVTTDEFSFDSEPAPPQNGVNRNEFVQEWVRITFDLNNGITFPNLIGQLIAGDLRIGVHVIALPDGSSESAVLIPEPVTICLLGLGSLALLRKRRTRVEIRF